MMRNVCYINVFMVLTNFIYPNVYTRIMKKKSDKKKLWTWLPRIIALAFIVFISLFALDSFDGVSPWYVQLGAFLIHLIPTYVLIAAYLVVRKWPVIGGWIFIAFGIIFAVTLFTIFSLQPEEGVFNPAIFIIALPIIVVGVLYIVSAKILKKPL